MNALNFSNLTTAPSLNYTVPFGNDTFANVKPYKIWSDTNVTRVVLYGIIFFFTVVGNILVIMTLAQNKRMRTVTNVFLINLAVSDLLLGVLCMPFTLVGSLLRDFVFGEVMCKAIPYAQAVSVSVSVWTLVSISLERYFAICRPLHSRTWQTISHAYRIIALIWTCSLFTMMPIALLSNLIPTKTNGQFLGKHKCREIWPDISSERAFNLYLNVVLLLIPLLIMTCVYSLIVRTLSVGIKLDNTSAKGSSSNIKLTYNGVPPVLPPVDYADKRRANVIRKNQMKVVANNTKKTQDAKVRVIRLLFILVVEFFVCWTPLYIMNTWILFEPYAVYKVMSPTAISAIQLLAYTSSCCNPITYCFLHSKFRQGFLNIMGCHRPKTKRTCARDSTFSGTLTSVYSTRIVTPNEYESSQMQRYKDDTV